MKKLAFFIVAVVAAASIPDTANALSYSCESARIKAEKACPAKRKRPSSTCKKRTKQLNKCLQEVAELTPPASVCIQLWSPVCAAQTGGKPETYANSCEATAAVATIISDGECR